MLRGRCKEAFARVGRRLYEPAIGARMDVATWDRAVQRCERLLDTKTATVLLHGDLHLGNVLDGGPGRGLMAIDPKACVGDPCFDAVDYVVAGAGLEGVGTRCARVAAACGLDGDRLQAWSRVIAPFAAIAHLGGDGEGPVIDRLHETLHVLPYPNRGPVVLRDPKQSSTQIYCAGSVTVFGKILETVLVETLVVIGTGCTTVADPIVIQGPAESARGNNWEPRAPWDRSRALSGVRSFAAQPGVPQVGVAPPSSRSAGPVVGRAGKDREGTRHTLCVRCSWSRG
ncbi:hypothetical protein ACVWZD_008968 [Streptomyces sp. TE3672]